MSMSIGEIAAQDTINIIYYNILNYPNPSNTDPDGNDAARAIAFREIMEASDADIILMEEMKSNAGASQLLTELNQNSLGKVFDKAVNFTGYGGNLGNMIFYNTNISTLLQEVEVPRVNSATSTNGTTHIAPRTNTYYEIEIFNPTNPAEKDKIHFFVGHFKSGQSTGSTSVLDDNVRRTLSALDAMDYIENNLQPTDNIIFGGDFNFYDEQPSTEPAYDLLMNNSSYSQDFVDILGAWTRNSSSTSNTCKYTQATRSANDVFGNGGPGGGLDDRFDFILINDAIDLGLNKTSYVPNSYEAYGSSKVLNSEVITGNSPVKTQLYEMSDHLPVIMQLELDFMSNCVITNSTVGNQNCINGDFTFDINVAAGNTSGMLEVVDISNGNSVIGTGTTSPINVVIPNNTNTAPFNIIVRDAVDNSCMSNVMTVAPIDCSQACDIVINSVNTTCLPNDTYDVEVCFNYMNTNSTNVNITIDGTTFGPYPYPVVSGGCVTVNGATIGAIGDATTGLNIRVEDAGGMSTPMGEPFISELHYDNAGTDTGEFVEITAPAGTDLSNYFLEFYNGANSYDVFPLTGIVPDAGSGCGAIQFLKSGIQNNGPDGIALATGTTVIEFISYEGTITASNGVATGIMSTDILVSEPSSSPIGESLQKTDSGWVGPISETPGIINTNLTSCGTSSTACFDETTFDEPDCITPFCQINITQITPTCLGDDTYDLDVCFTYQDPLSSQVNVTVDGVTYGPFAYPVSGGCITISGAMINVVGDGTTNLTVTVEDVMSNSAPPSVPFISEFHYDNNGSDVGEFIEISAISSVDLAGYSLELYNGNMTNILYQTIALSGMIGDDGMGCGALSFDATGIQNGGSGGSPHADAIALIDPSGTVIEFISYEGSLTAANGSAVGMTSIDVSVVQSSSTPIGASLKKEDGGWVVAANDSPGVFNTGLTSCGSSGVLCTASFTFDEPSCAVNCPVNIIENSASIASGIYQVSNNISSAGTVANTGNVTFDAAVDIDLLPNFCVPLGAEFQAIIGGCP